MGTHCYKDKRFNKSSSIIIDYANEIINEYAIEGYDLTLRQLYYQFVSRGLLENTQREYKRLGSIINDARMAGLINWYSIVDRTRSLRKCSHWKNAGEIVETCVQSFMLDRWENQDFRPEVWIEKDALIGVISTVCTKLDVPYFSCRGYTSQSAMWRASQRMHNHEGQVPFIIHLGDHDPSGIDMSRDIQDRLSVFGVIGLVFVRIALNREQINHYNPPPNPAKLTDTRANGYISEHGNQSWELDALEPKVISSLIKSTILGVRNEKIFQETMKREEKYIQQLKDFQESI